MPNVIFACMRPYADVEVKTAKRRMKCRICGRVIPKGEKYAVLEYFNGPYLRRKAVCIECARSWVEDNIICEAWRQAREAFRECMESRVRRSLAVQILRHFGVIIESEEEKRAREECARLLERALVVRLWPGMAESAEKLGIRPEEVVRRIYPRAKVEVVEP